MSRQQVMFKLQHLIKENMVSEKREYTQLLLKKYSNGTKMRNGERDKDRVRVRERWSEREREMKGGRDREEQRRWEGK